MSVDLPHELDLLLRGLHGPLATDLAHWERILRLARMTGLHGRLASANRENRSVPDVVARHLLSAARIAGFNSRMLHAELSMLAPLCDTGFPVIAVKGSAYALQQLPMAVGRFASDVDLLVPATALRDMEQRLHAAGWKAAELDAYDERYYRDWSHETPPMRYPGHFLELDLHHAITPVTGSVHFDPAPLFEASVPVPGSVFRVLCREDQVLHACVHCFHDGDLDLRLREVVDIDALLREFSATDGFWDRLRERAATLGLERPLWYGLHFARRWMRTPVPDAMMNTLPAPPQASVSLMGTLVDAAMLPSDPDFPPPLKVRVARVATLARCHWLRMPLHILVPHLARKLVLRARDRFAQRKASNKDAMPDDPPGEGRPNP